VEPNHGQEQQPQPNPGQQGRVYLTDEELQMLLNG